MNATELETKDATGNAVKPLKRHILIWLRKEDPQPERALCGHLWDRLHPISGDLCEACVREYRRIWPFGKLPA